MSDQSFCLKWDGHHSSVTSLLSELRDLDELLDVTLCCDDFSVRAHRLLLSACSPYLRRVLKVNPCQHMVFYMKDTSASDLRAIVEFIYKGCVNVSQNQLPSFIKLADSLQIRGLSGEEEKVVSPGSPTMSAPAARAKVQSPVVPVDSITPAPGGSRQDQQESSTVPPAKRRRQQQNSDDDVQSQTVTPLPCHSPSPIPPDQQQQQQQQPLPSPDASLPPDHHLLGAELKVEKVDLTELSDEEDETELALGRLADYEAVGELSEAALLASGLPASLLTVGGSAGGIQGGPALYTDGGSTSSQINTDDSMSQGGVTGCMYVCRDCGRRYASRVALSDHSKMHAGLTVCSVCGKVATNVSNLRKHMMRVHGWSREQVQMGVPGRSSLQFSPSERSC